MTSAKCAVEDRTTPKLKLKLKVQPVQSYDEV